MSVRLHSSHEFASLVKQLQKSPDDPLLKRSVVSFLPAMMALSKVNPLALYRLAQVHSPTSPQYKQMMTRSATMGCTNAMLAMCQVLLQSSDIADLKKAAEYMLKIESSEDTYIKKEARSLLGSHPRVLALMNTTDGSYSKSLRFFSNALERNVGHYQSVHEVPAAETNDSYVNSKL